jgi:translocation and assembly module TamB
LSEARPGRSRRRAALLGGGAVLAATAAGLWLAREPIASDVLDRELARRGVAARYAVDRIGLRTQRLRDVRIGDPRRPDLVADWIEVDLAPTFGAPEVRAVRAGGVRLRAVLGRDGLTLGALDRLLPAGAGGPFRLPDLPVRIADARLDLATAAGTVRIRLDGAGNLRSGFAGRLGAAAPRLSVGGCRLSGAAARLRLRTRDGRPRVDGPIAANALACPAAGVAAVSGQVDATLAPGLDGWRGYVQLAGGGGGAAGWAARGLRGEVDFAGTARRTEGTLRLAAKGVRGAPARADAVEIAGRYRFGPEVPDRLPGDPPQPPVPGWRFEGRASAAGLVPAGGLPAVPAGEGTPLAPLLGRAAALAERAAGGASLRASLIAAAAGDAGSVRIDRARLAAAGAELRFAGGEGLRLVWPGKAAWQIDGRLRLTAPGLPSAVAEVRQRAPGSPLAGRMRVAGWAGEGLRLQPTEIRFADGRFATRIALDGPLLGGRIDGLVLPVAGTIGAGLRVNAGCSPLAFDRLRLAGLDLAETRLSLCGGRRGLVSPAGLDGRIDAPRLAGRLGESPLLLAAAALRLRADGFEVRDLAVRLGVGEETSRLDIARLTGRATDALAGRYAGAAGTIGQVPLRVTEAGGDWRLAGGVLTLAGDLRLSDTANPPRFETLAARDFALRFAGGRIRAEATLRPPGREAVVTAVSLSHEFATGAGAADLRVPGIAFGPGLQPDQLTRLALGVVANVEGDVQGTGRIAWRGDAVSSSGRFQVEAPALAAAFGPVTGLRTELVFTDLLGLVTADDQVATVASLNPGVLVEDGVVRYRLIPGQRVEVLGGAWPFAGGRLTLRPTILDFGQEVPRRLTFDVDGLDAARFITKLEVKNLDATGTFDGVLPMVFDQNGGRITGGTLAARPPGGRIAYVGEVSNADLGIWGDIAFDALKSIAYRDLVIDMNGDIDGEMVSQIRFDGISRGTIEPVATGFIATVGGRLASQIQQMPFRFNIRIRAPFRGLISTARSFYDPGILVRDRLPAGLEPAPPSVQPRDSRIKP